VHLHGEALPENEPDTDLRIHHELLLARIPYTDST